MTSSPALLADIDSWILGGTLSFVRLAPSFFMLPFFNSGVLAGPARAAVVMIVALGFWPVPLSFMADITMPAYLAALAREAMIGLVLAILLCWPFWVFHAVGSLIDNQRGATISSTIDPVNGEETSELSNLFNWFAAAIFLYGGGLGLFVHLVDASYRLCDPLQSCRFHDAPLTGLLSALAARMLALAAPVVAVMLLCEMALGLLSRFSPQLNAFSVSLTIKSLVAVFILLMYFAPVLPAEVARLSARIEALPHWFGSP